MANKLPGSGIGCVPTRPTLSKRVVPESAVKRNEIVSPGKSVGTGLPPVGTPSLSTTTGVSWNLRSPKSWPPWVSPFTSVTMLVVRPPLPAGALICQPTLKLELKSFPAGWPWYAESKSRVRSWMLKGVVF